MLTEWTQSESLRKHALAVEICVTACGEAESDRLGLTGEERDGFIELYTTTGLLHDFDYERHPTPRSTLSSGCASWSAWAGRLSSAPRSWDMRNTPASRALRT